MDRLVPHGDMRAGKTVDETIEAMREAMAPRRPSPVLASFAAALARHPGFFPFLPELLEVVPDCFVDDLSDDAEEARARSLTVVIGRSMFTKLVAFSGHGDLSRPFQIADPADLRDLGHTLAERADLYMRRTNDENRPQIVMLQLLASALTATDPSRAANDLGFACGLAAKLIRDEDAWAHALQGLIAICQTTPQRSVA